MLTESELIERTINHLSVKVNKLGRRGRRIFLTIDFAKPRQYFGEKLPRTAGLIHADWLDNGMLVFGPFTPFRGGKMDPPVPPLTTFEAVVLTDAIRRDPKVIDCLARLEHE